MMLLVDYI